MTPKPASAFVTRPGISKAPNTGTHPMAPRTKAAGANDTHLAPTAMFGARIPQSLIRAIKRICVETDLTHQEALELALTEWAERNPVTR